MRVKSRNFTLCGARFSADDPSEMIDAMRTELGLFSAFCGFFLAACGSASTGGQGSQTPSGGNGGAAVAGAGAGGGAMANGGANANGGSSTGGTTANGGSATGGVSSTAGNGGTLGASGGNGVGGMSGSGGSGGQTNGPTLVYVGSTNRQISIFSLDAASGKLGLIKSIDAGNYPSFLALDPSRTHLYAVNEPDAMVASFKVDPVTGDLTFLNRVASGGGSPAHIYVEQSGKYVMVANYDGGTTRVFPIAADGSLGAPTDNKAPGKWSHMILTDAANKFAFVMSKGDDLIAQYVFDSAHGTLMPNSAAIVKSAAGAGPRHLAWHPSGKFAYVIDENDDTMMALSYNAAVGQLTLLQTLSTLPMGADGTSNTCAEVVVAPSGNFVYGSNRGNDSIVTFSVDGTSGKLKYIGVTPSGGNTPRSFTLSADGKLMLVANESGNVTSFSVNTSTGALSKISSVSAPVAPEFVGIFTLPGQH